ncbi:MAG: hypothetical protein RLZZ618_4193 [Pseudomonadota bacterium]
MPGQRLFASAGPRAGWRCLLVLVGLLAMLAFGPLQAQDLQKVPPLSGRVVDQTGTLTPPQQQALSAKLSAIERQHGSQLVILMVDTIAPEDVAAYAQRVGEAWKIGRRQIGDGLLIVVVKRDRKVRIEVAKGLEGAVPDLAARRIITEALTPAFKAGDYAGGLNLALDQLTRRIAAEGLAKPPTARPDADSSEVVSGAASSASNPLGSPDLTPFDNSATQPSTSPGKSSKGDPDLPWWIFALILAVPLLGVVVIVAIGRKLGAVGMAGVVGGLAFWITSSVVAAVLLGGVAFLLIGLMKNAGQGGMSSFLINILSALASSGGSSSSSGGWGGGGGGGNSGFSSGGGGDFGGGGASGDW